MIKAIETQYKGYRFRSRLEAKWAVLFERLGIEWEYEKEGYDLGEAGWYLPDFWLPELKCFVEIKGDDPAESEIQKCFELAVQSEHPVILFCGTMGYNAEFCNVGNAYWVEHTHKTHVFFGWNIPPEEFDRDRWFAINELLDLKYGVYSNLVENGGYSKDELPVLANVGDASIILSPVEGNEQFIYDLIQVDRKYYQEKYGEEHKRWKYGISSGFLTGTFRENFYIERKEDGRFVAFSLDGGFGLRDIDHLYQSVRGLRFEHGESPR